MNMTTQQTPKLLLTAREAAAALSISEKTLWSLTKAGEVPHVRIGERSIRYSVDELKRWLSEHRIGGEPAAASTAGMYDTCCSDHARLR